MGRRINTYQGPGLLGWLALAALPALTLGMAISLGLGGSAISRCLVRPATALGQINPVFNPAPVAILVAVAITCVFVHDSYRVERARGWRLIKETFQGLLGGGLIGWIVALLLTTSAAGLNARLDRSAPQQHRVTVIGHVIDEDRYRTYAHLAVTDWRDPGSPPTQVCVNGGRGIQFDQVLPPPGTPVTVTTRRGWLGQAWVSAVEGDRPPPAPR